MEQLVVSFPALAAWLIVAIGGLLLTIVAYGGKQLLKRLDVQDAALESIRDLLASEVKQLREMQHGMDVRVVRLEAFREQALQSEHWGKRFTDQEHNGY